ncbi:hypothetical protein LIA77_09924 [Sarocladium implicatum]|nr:hypothetical protein LIA77_09924 [Sarocladium implicatum]
MGIKFGREVYKGATEQGRVRRADGMKCRFPRAECQHYYLIKSLRYAPSGKPYGSIFTRMDKMKSERRRRWENGEREIGGKKGRGKRVLHLSPFGGACHWREARETGGSASVGRRTTRDAAVAGVSV